MAYNSKKPYNDIPALPPKKNVETTSVLKKITTTSRALSELKGMVRTIPNPAILVNTLVLHEARASSRIENILTTKDELYVALAISRRNINPAVKEVLTYREAIWYGFNLLTQRNTIDTDLFIEIVQAIKDEDIGIRTGSGTRVRDGNTGEVIYTPPDGEVLIRTKSDDLAAFINSEDNLDPLIKLGLIHYQFEAIHPFPDGNGRTGRILNILFLIREGLLDLPILYMSKYIIENKSEYYKLLIGVTEDKAWEPWILYMLDAVEYTSEYTSKKISEIYELMVETEGLLRSKASARIPVKELTELIFTQVYTKAKFVVEAGIAERQTAAEYLKELQKIGVLTVERIGRENIYKNVKLYHLLSR